MRPETESIATLETQDGEPMRAVLAAPGRIEVQPFTPRKPEAGEVLVRLEGCGVCASNLAPWAGAEWFEYPFPPGEPGHEGWGVVEEVGDAVADLHVGDRVATLANGAYATHLTLPALDAIAIPRGLEGRPVPGEPLGCVVNIFRRSEISAGQTVAVIGTGFLGLLLTQLATRAGATVIAISRRNSSRAAARAMGAEHVVEMDDHWRIIEVVRELTDGHFCDRVIEAVGKQWPLDLAGELTREGGRMVVAGYHQDGPRQVNMQLWNWRGFDVINAHERDPEVVRGGVREAIDAVASGRLDPFPLFSHRFPLDELNEALDAARDRPEGFLKALVTYE